MIAAPTFAGRRVIVVGAIIGAVGAIGIAIGFAMCPDRALAAYLAAWAAVATPAFGAVAGPALT